MKKVLFVANTLQMGGAERILYNVIKNIDKTKYDVTVLALVNYGVFVDEIKKIDGVKYIGGFNGVFGKTKLNEKSLFYKIENKIMTKKLKKYTKIIREHAEELYPKFIKDEYDVEIAFLEGRVSRFVSKSTNPKSKKISWIHTDVTNITDENFLNLQDEIECCKVFDKVVCVSNSVREKFIKKTGISKNVQVQINPIDSCNILSIANEAIDLPKNDGELVICGVGRLEPVKGFDRLLMVHKKLVDEGIKHKLWIVGDGKQRAALEEYIKSNKLEESAILVGYDKNPYKYMKNADIYVCSSLVEGLSSTVIEAVILKKIIVTTECPGMEEILGSNNENALIVSNNEDGIYQGLREILTDSNLRNKYATSVKSISSKFDLNTKMREIENIIDN